MSHDDGNPMRAFTFRDVAGVVGRFLVAASFAACGSTGSPAQPAGPGSPGDDDAQADVQSDVGSSDAIVDMGLPDGAVVDAGMDAIGDAPSAGQ
jgi:hypothetical protein